MSDLFTLVADRIRETCPSAGVVRAATSAAEADSEPLGSTAAAFVIPSAERFERVREAGLHVTQPGAIGVSIVIGLTAPGGFPEWSALRAELLDALAGWTPADWPTGAFDEAPARPMEYAGARLLAFNPEQGGRWLHSFDFTLPVQASYEHKS